MVKTKTSRIDKKAKETPGTLICTGYFYMFHSVLSCVILTALSNRNQTTGIFYQIIRLLRSLLPRRERSLAVS